MGGTRISLRDLTSRDIDEKLGEEYPLTRENILGTSVFGGLVSLSVKVIHGSYAHSGYLFKKARENSYLTLVQWRRRFFILHNNGDLEYYDKEESSFSNPAMLTLPFDPGTVVKEYKVKQGFGFIISHPKRQIFAYAESHEERNGWIEVLQDCFNDCSGSLQYVPSLGKDATLNHGPSRIDSLLQSKSFSVKIDETIDDSEVTDDTQKESINQIVASERKSNLNSKEEHGRDRARTAETIDSVQKSSRFRKILSRKMSLRKISLSGVQETRDRAGTSIRESVDYSAPELVDMKLSSHFSSVWGMLSNESHFRVSLLRAENLQAYFYFSLEI